MQHRIAFWRSAAFAISLAGYLDIASAQVSDEAQAKAMQDYEETVRQADAQVSAGNPFEAVRLYERAGRVAYNNKLATDSAALSAKLATARASRDSKSAAGTTGKRQAAASPPPTASSTPPGSAGPVAGNSSVQDFAAWVRYGDDLAKVSEYIDAVRAYERARRIAAANRLEVDRTSLDAKIAAAAQARDAPRPATELIPAPLPPIPDAPGAEPGPKWLTDQPGRLLPWSLSAIYSKAEMHVTDGEFKAFEANLRRIMDVVTKATVLNPPRGFEFSVSATLSGMEDVKERERYVANHLPLRAAIRFSGSSYVEMKQRSKKTGAASVGVGVVDEAFCRYEITVNVPPFYQGHITDEAFTNGKETFFLEPKKDGELGGQPVYADTLVIAKPGAVLWTPVSTERALKALMPGLKSASDTAASGIEGAKKAYAEFMSAEAMDKRRREVEGLRNAGGTSAEDNARRLEVKQRRWEEDARKAAESAANDPKHRVPMEAYQNAQAMLASLDAQGKLASACIMQGPMRSSTFEWRVVPLGTAGCRPLMEHNPGLLSGKLPRSALQVMYVGDVTVVNRWFLDKRFLRNKPGDCLAMAKILREVNWQQLAGLLAP